MVAVSDRRAIRGKVERGHGCGSLQGRVEDGVVLRRLAEIRCETMVLLRRVLIKVRRVVSAQIFDITNGVKDSSNNGKERYLTLPTQLLWSTSSQEAAQLGEASSPALARTRTTTRDARAIRSGYNKTCQHSPSQNFRQQRDLQH